MLLSMALEHQPEWILQLKATLQVEEHFQLMVVPRLLLSVQLELVSQALELMKLRVS